MTLIRSKNILLLLALNCLWSVASLTTHAQYQINSWTTDNGLPQNTIYSILQTPDGYLWMTTLDGLVRFDGVQFKVFNKNNTKGIETNRFTKLVLDGRGDLWIAAEKDFVTRYHQGTFQTFNFNLSGQNSSVSKGLFLNSQREIVLATKSGIFRWNGESFTDYATAAEGQIEDIIFWSKNGTLWYARGSTLFRVKDDQTREYRLPAIKGDTLITRILEDSRGRVWLGTHYSGLFYFENEKINYFPLEDVSGYVAPSIEDSNGNVWAVSGKGAVIIAPDGTVTRVTTAQGLSEDLVASVFQDREGNIWIGTTHRGLNRLNRQSVAFYSVAEGLTAAGVSPIFQDRDGTVWIGGENLTKYGAGNFSGVTGREKFPKAVTAIGQDRAGRLWFGHWGGAYYFENDQFKDFTGKFGRYVAVFAIYEDKNGVMWFATNSGLYRYQNDVMTQFTTADGLAENDVKVIRESNDGTLWVGTYGGLTRIKNNVLTSFTTGDGLASNLVRSVYEDADATLWIGSYDGGLTRFKNEKFTRYTSNDGLFNDGVFQILEDASNNLWMSSNRGIYLVAKQQLDDFADGKIKYIESIAYNKADGLLETECNGGQQPSGIKSRDGKLWFPTQGGAAVVDPEKIKSNDFAPPVVIETIKIDNEESALPAANSAIEIASDKNNLEIAYSGLSFIKPELINFRYRLEGLNENWTEAENRRTAYFSYLPPGEYTFQVIAANSDGVWNTTGASVKINVLPPFYRTWWFWILSTAFIGGAAFVFYRQRVTILEKEKSAQQAFSGQLIESQEQDRKRIAAELHDGLGQSLVIIKNRALMSLDKRDKPERAFEQLDEIAAAATEAINEVREITYNLRPYQLDRLGLSKAIVSMVRRVGDEIEFATKIDNIDGAFPSEIEINVYRIVQEPINNIIKHSNANRAEIHIERTAHGVDILIRDNGDGFDTNTAASGFGLIGIAERARMLGGSFSIQSTLGKGTTINIKLPVSDLNGREK